MPLPPIVYINLARDEGRRRHMEAEFAAQGVAARRFDAVDWRALAPQRQAAYTDAALNRRQFHRSLVPGEMGCYASHVEVWRELVAGGEPAAVVLEDDVRLLPGFAAVCDAVARLDRPWHLVKLIGREGTGRAEKAARRWPLCDGHDLIAYRRVPSLAAGYLVSREGAARLLAARVPFGRPVDVDLRFWWECGDDFALYGVSPPVLGLDAISEQSSIGAQHRGGGLAQRWRKFAHKVGYTIGNAHARHRRGF